MKYIKSILSGAFIGLGTTAFLMTGNAFVFTIGIFLVFNFTGCLITGYVPSSTYDKSINIKNTLIILIGNLIGSYMFGLLISYTRIYNKIKPLADDIVAIKLNDNYISIFIMAILCVALIGYGMIGTTFVEGYISKVIILLFPTFIFVVMGLEHIVANSFYVSIALGTDIMKAIPLIAISAIGNILGGIIVGYTQRKILE